MIKTLLSTKLQNTSFILDAIPLYYPHHPITTLTTMEYPGSRLTKPWRQLILVLFIAAFFIISPLIILYTAGYRFDVRFGLVREVGIISIDGIPHTAQVALNHLIQKNHVPATLNAIVPGAYHLTLFAPGFHPWEQNILVRAKETTYIKDVDLPRVATPELITSSTIDNILTLPSLGAIIYTEKKDSGTHIVYQSLTDSRLKFTSTTKNMVTKLISSPHDEFVILQFSSSTPLIFNTKSQLFSSFTTSTTNQIYWDPQGEDTELYGQTTDTIYTINLVHGAVTNVSKLPELPAEWRPFQGSIWTLTTSTTNTSGLSIERRKNGLVFNERLEWNKTLRSWAEGTLWHFSTILQDLVILRRNTLSEMALISNKKITTLPVHSFNCEEKIRVCVFYGQSEIWNYTEGEEPKFVYRSSEPLVAAGIMNATDLYLFANENRLFSYQNFYGITTDLAHDITIHKAYTIPQIRTIVFLGNYNHRAGLWKLSY